MLTLKTDLSLFVMIILLILKVCGYFNHSWWWLAAPFIVEYLIVALLVIYKLRK